MTPFDLAPSAALAAVAVLLVGLILCAGLGRAAMRSRIKASGGFRVGKVGFEWSIAAPGEAGDEAQTGAGAETPAQGSERAADPPV